MNGVKGSDSVPGRRREKQVLRFAQDDKFEERSRSFAAFRMTSSKRERVLRCVHDDKFKREKQILRFAQDDKSPVGWLVVSCLEGGPWNGLAEL